MPIENNAQEPTADDIYLAKMTMDEVGADIEKHGHIAVTDENRTQDPFTTKGSLANALDEALDYSNPNYDPTNESQGDVEGVTNAPQSFKKSDEEIKPDDTTMDKAPEVPDTIANNEKAKTAKDSLSEVLDSVFAMDAVTEVPEETDDEVHHKWQHKEIEKNVPKIPESMGGGDQSDSNGLIYLDYTFTVDPEKYNSPNYQPIADTGEMDNDAAKAIKKPNEQAANDKVDEDISVEEMIVEAGGEPSKDAEKEAAKAANEDEKEVASIGKPIEKKAEDEAVEKVVLDYATFIDGSSFMCFDEDTGVDYTKIVMDAGPKKPVTRQTCKTTFAQCRAKNPLFCRFHGPKLLEKDIKSAISAALGKGCVVSVTKDKGQKNPLTFRLTIGCPPAMKKDVEKIVHMFMTQNPGISSPEEYKDLGKGKQTTEFDMDILKADEPPKKNDLKGQAAQWETEKAKAKGKTMPVVGETPPKVEKLASQGGAQKTEAQPPTEEVEEKVEEAVEQPEKEDDQTKANESSPSNPDDATSGSSQKKGNYEVPIEQFQDEFNSLVDKAIDEGYFKVAQFQKEYEGIIPYFSDSAEVWASKLDSMKSLMEKYKPADKGEEDKALKSLEDDFNAALMEYPENGGGADNDAKNVEINEAFTKAYAAKDQKGMESAIGAMKKLVADVKGEEGGEGKGDTILDVLGVLSGLNHEIPDFNISYDAMGAKNPTDIKISAYGDGDFGAMLNKVDSMLANVGYGVSGTNGNNMHIVEKGGGDAKKEAALGKVKEALKGTGYENGDLQYADFGDAGQEVYIANTDSGTLEAIINKDGEIVFGVHDDGGGTWANSAKEAIKDFEENYGGSANGAKDSSSTSADAPGGFHYVDDAAMKEIDDLAHENPELISSDDNVSALYYGAKQAIDGLDFYKQGLEEIDAKLKELEGRAANGLSASGVLEKLTLKNSRKTQQEAYDDAKAHAELSVKDFKEAVEKAKSAVVDSIKGTNAEMVENIVKTTARAIFKNGKPDGVDSVVDMIDALHEDMTSLANEKLGEGGDLHTKFLESKKKNGLHEAYKAVSSASLEFDGAVSSFKDLIDGVKSKDGAESLKEAVNGIGEYSQKLKDAFAAYKMAVDKVKKDVTDLAEMKEKEEKLSQGETNSETDAKVAESKSDIKAKIAAMSVKEKMEKSIPLLEKKIKAEPNNEKWQKMLEQAKAYLASHKD